MQPNFNEMLSRSDMFESLIIKDKSLSSQVPLQGGAHIKECET